MYMCVQLVACFSVKGIHAHVHVHQYSALWPKEGKHCVKGEGNGGKEGSKWWKEGRREKGGRRGGNGGRRGGREWKKEGREGMVKGRGGNGEREGREW